MHYPACIIQRRSVPAEGRYASAMMTDGSPAQILLPEWICATPPELPWAFWAL